MIWADLSEPIYHKNCIFSVFQLYTIYIRFLKVFLYGFRGFSIWETRIRYYFLVLGYPWDTLYRKTSGNNYKKELNFIFKWSMCIAKKNFSCGQTQKIPSDSSSPCRKTPEYKKSADLETFWNFEKIWTGDFLALTTKKSIFRPLELRILQK